MSNATNHEIMTVELEDGVPTSDVPPATLRSGLESDNDIVRTQAATVAAGLSETDPESVTAALPALFDGLDDDQRVVIYQSMLALSNVAEDEPERLEPAIERLVELSLHDLPLIRTLSARILGFVALENPSLFTEYVDTLVEATAEEPSNVLDPEALDEAVQNHDRREALDNVNREGRTQQVLAREIIINLLVEVAEYEPAQLKPHVPTLIELLPDDDVNVVTGSIDILATLAEDDPATVADAVGPLCDLLDHRDDSVVANAISALGFIDDPDAVGPLRTLAQGDSDRDEELLALADETADFIAEGH